MEWTKSLYPKMDPSKAHFIFSYLRFPLYLWGSQYLINNCVKFHVREPQNEKVTANSLLLIL